MNGRKILRSRLACAAVLLTAACSGSDGTGPSQPRTPTANAGVEQTVTLGETAHLDGSASASRSGSSLAFSWSFLSRPAGSATALVSPQNPTSSFVVDAAGDFTLELRVSDSGGVAADTVIVHTNRRPVIDAGTDANVTTSDSVALDGSHSSDPDGNALSYAWTLITTPAGSTATLGSANSARPSFVADVSGTYRAVLQLSDGQATAADTVTIRATFNFSSISTAGTYTCGVLTSGRLYCWGSGALGFGAADPTVFPTSSRPHRVISPETFQTVSAGGSVTAYFVCGVTTSGKGYCWGANSFGQLGASTRTAIEPTPVAVAGALNFRSISAGQYGHACGVTTTGAAYCWGNGGTGALGNNSHLSSTTPVPVSGGHSFQTVVALTSSSCGLTTAGDIYCWGGAPDLLGNGESSADHPTPIQIASGRTWARLVGTTGDAHQAVCAVATTGEAACWGFNDYGKLGNGRMADCYGGSGPCEWLPVAVQGGGTWRAVSPGGSHSCGLTLDGTPFCWGLDNHGQLGTEVSTTCESVGFPPACSLAPVAIPTLLRFTSISASAYHTCALTALGEAYCWGINGSGALGDGTQTERRVPTRVVTP